MDRIPHSKSISCYRPERLRISNSQRKPLELSLAGLCRLCTQHPTAEFHQTVGFHRPKCKERLKPGAIVRMERLEILTVSQSLINSIDVIHPCPWILSFEIKEVPNRFQPCKTPSRISSHLDVEESLVPWPLGLHAPIDQHMQSRLHLLHHSPWQPEFKIKRPNT